MNKLKTIVLALCSLFLYLNAYSQTSLYKFQGENKYSKAKIYFKNNNRIEVRNLIITNDHLTFINKATSRKGEYDLKDVYVIKASQGTRAVEYALFGGAAFGIAALISIVAYPSNSYYKTPSAGPWIAGWTAGGLLIGAIVGTFSDKWKTIYVSEQDSFLNSAKINFYLDPKRHSFGLQLTFTF